MPFDNLPTEVLTIAAEAIVVAPPSTWEREWRRDKGNLQTMEVYRQRREAAAALWRDLPRGQFDVNRWCTCSLGWLANKRIDGWRWMPFWSFPSMGGAGPYDDAAEYFGMTAQDAHYCFRGGYWVRPTANDVASRVLAQRYVAVDA